MLPPQANSPRPGLARGGIPGRIREGAGWILSCSGPVSAMSFGIYLAGILLVLGGLIYAASMVHVPLPWIVAGALVILGFGILMAVKSTRQRDPAG